VLPLTFALIRPNQEREDRPNNLAWGSTRLFDRTAVERTCTSS
jgi:hypothetical protein